MASIEVEAFVDHDLGGLFEAYEVLIDGLARGRVPSGETRAFDVSPGIHTIRLEVGAFCPPPVKVVVGFGKTSLVCQTKAHRRFGLFSAPVPRAHIQVREFADVPASICWQGATASLAD